jgi:hypothetical protein
MLVPVKPFYPSLIFAINAKAFTREEYLKTLWDEHSSLFGLFFSDEEKEKVL